MHIFVIDMKHNSDTPPFGSCEQAIWHPEMEYYTKSKSQKFPRPQKQSYCGVF